MISFPWRHNFFIQYLLDWWSRGWTHGGLCFVWASWPQGHQFRDFSWNRYMKIDNTIHSVDIYIITSIQTLCVVTWVFCACFSWLFFVDSGSGPWTQSKYMIEAREFKVDKYVLLESNGLLKSCHSFSSIPSLLMSLCALFVYVNAAHFSIKLRSWYGIYSICHWSSWRKSISWRKNGRGECRYELLVFYNVYWGR